ncbi:MAG: sensor histidine kinase [Plesiomonas sp.]|uniref:sensor histidine kinase n=1 Tax=Plesiomonas sp. TaxID=2486279 RepID=UPI003F33E4AB
MSEAKTEQLAVIERIIRDYFMHPEYQLCLHTGDVLMDQGQFNDRLYYVREGQLKATVKALDDIGEEEQTELFLASPGTFIGVHSFFSYRLVASSRVVAETKAELAWIDLRTVPVDRERFGSLSEQFMPVIVEELQRRQWRLSQMAREQEAANRRLHLAEKLSTLGQLAAGLAHELNNAVGVLARKSDYLSDVTRHLLKDRSPALITWFDQGREQGQLASSLQVRNLAHLLRDQFALSHAQAKTWARALGDQPVPEHLPEHLDEALQLWEIGRDCYDMQLAARHASGIVKSVKQLGGGDYQRQWGVDVNDSLHEALSLLQSPLREVNVELNLGELSPIYGNHIELVQMWVNIIKNGWDAMKEAHTPNPTLWITSRVGKRSIQVILSNNGPMIPEEIAARIFQPNFTTKKRGQTVGLGLGLYIVKRLAESYGGDLLLKSSVDYTQFRVRIPLQQLQ